MDTRRNRKAGQYVAWTEAHRQLGRKYWKWYVYGWLIKPLAAVILIGALLAAVWTIVPHVLLTAATGGFGLALLALAAVAQLSMAGTRARMTGAGTGMPVVLTLIGSLLMAFAVVMVRYG
jgi:uncharacterized membrane protein